MPRTGTNLCHPKIGYVDLTRNPALDILALNSPLGHFNGDQRTPLHQMDKNHGDSKIQSLTRQTTHAAISTFSTSHNIISSPYSQPFTSLAALKANPIFHAANKNLILKHISTIAILLLHHPPFITYKLSEGTNNTKRGSNQHNINTHTLQPILANKQTFPRLLTNQLLQLKSSYKNSS